MKRILLISVFLISLIGFMSANLGTFKQGECVNIRTILSSSTVNISTISYPNSTIIVLDIPMTKNAQTFNYTYCNTSAFGNYIYDYYDKEGNVYVNDFEITPSGKTFSEGESLAGLGIILGTLAAAFFFMSFGFKLSENERLFPIVLLFMLFSIFFIIYFLHLSYVFTVDILQYESLTGTASVVYTSLLWILALVGIISVVLILIASIKAMGEAAKKREYGEDFNPISNSYDKSET